MEPSPRFELGPSAVPGRRSDRWSYEGTCWPGWNRTSVVTWFQAGPCQQSSRPPEPPPGAAPGWPDVQGPPGRWTRGQSVLGATRTRTAGHLKAVPPAVGLRGHESRRPVPTRASRLTRAGPQPCATAGTPFAGELPLVDSNHDRRFQGPLSCQLDERASRTTGFEPGGFTGLALPRLPCAAGGSNSVPRFKRPVHHPSCLQRLYRREKRAVPGSRTPMPGLEDRRLNR